MSAALIAIKEELLAACAAGQPVRLTRHEHADVAVLDWNAVYAVVGSFAGEHSTL